MSKRSKFAQYPRLNPPGLGKNMSAADLVEKTCLAYNGGRLRKAAQLLTEKMLPDDGVIGLSLTGALTPAGLGKSCLIPPLRAGFVDWIVSTGANLYHDLHFGLGMALHQGSPFLDDVALHRQGVIRIYDILFDFNVLLDTDAFVREVIRGAEFQRTMGTDEFHYRLGQYVWERGRKLRLQDSSVLAAAYERGVPVFTSSPGDSSIGMNWPSTSTGMSIKRRPSSLTPNPAGANPPSLSWAAGRPRISCCRRSRKSRKSWASRKKAAITSCNAPTRGPTPAG
jgi:deoxyhypusine synthase